MSPPESLATDQEVRASLVGAAPPGAQAYSYRSLSAGLTRSEVEHRLASGGAVDSSACGSAPNQSGELSCTYTAVLAPDSARVRVEASYSGATAREIAVSRDLPIAVDGMRLAQELANAFERQTTLLDRRESSFDHDSARVQMGTVSGTRQNFVDITVAPHDGRQRLVVHMRRAMRTTSR